MMAYCHDCNEHHGRGDTRCALVADAYAEQHGDTEQLTFPDTDDTEGDTHGTRQSRNDRYGQDPRAA